jgi:hypothetical protein
MTPLIVLFYSVDNNVEDLLAEINNDLILNKYIYIMCVDNPQILSWLTHNEKGISITTFPVFVVSESDNPVVYNVSDKDYIYMLANKINSSLQQYNVDCDDIHQNIITKLKNVV